MLRKIENNRQPRAFYSAISKIIVLSFSYHCALPERLSSSAHSCGEAANQFRISDRKSNHPVSRSGCHPSFVRRGAVSIADLGFRISDWNRTAPSAPFCRLSNEGKNCLFPSANKPFLSRQRRLNHPSLTRRDVRAP